MRCIERVGQVGRAAKPDARIARAVSGLLLVTLLSACGSGTRMGGAVGSGSAAGTGGADSTVGAANTPGAPNAGRAPPSAATTAGTIAAPLPTAGAVATLGAPVRSRSWAEFQVNAARRMVAANPGKSYTGKPPEPLLAIPVLEIELNANGSVRRINIMRTPSQATDTVQLAVNAIHRAAPFGDVSHLPRPWKFTEVFLFDDERRFKPRTLD